MWRNFLLPAWIIGTAASFALPETTAWTWWAVAAAVCAAAGKYYRPLLPLAALLAGFAWGVFRTDAALSRQWPADHRTTQTVLTITIDSLPDTDTRRTRFTATARDQRQRTYRLQLSDYALRQWRAGEIWSVTATVRAPVGENNPHGFSREAWALANGIDGIGTIGRERRYLGSNGISGSLLRLRENISRRWQYFHRFENGAALMRALGIGEQNALPAESWAAFRPLGLNHLVSISGLHVNMVALLAAWLARRVLRHLPFSFHRPRTVVALAALISAGAYACMAGLGVPVVRAFAMLAILAFFWARYGIQAAWKSWWWALFTVLLFDPFAVLAAGTWLSFGLVAALIWAGSWRAGTGKRSFLRVQWAALLASFVSVGYLFSALPLLSPLVNLIAIPWFSWVLVPLALLGSLFPIYPLQWLAAALGEYTLTALGILGGIAPEYGMAAPPLPLIAAAVAALGILLLPRGLGWKPLAWVTLLGLAVYRPPAPPSGSLKLTVWDIGQGLAVSFQTTRHHLLFDTGSESAAALQLIPNLRATGTQRLDALVLSHHDNDHDGGQTLITRAFRPHTVWAGQPQFYADAADCHAEQSWTWDGVHFEWLTVPPEVRRHADNDQSCILRVVSGSQAVLVTGDLGSRGERALVERYGSTLYSQVLVLGHHGSRFSSSGTFLNTVSPRYAVAASGYANAFKHPNAVVQNRLSAHGIRLLRTDLGGAQTFILGGDTLQAAAIQRRFYWQKKPFAVLPETPHDKQSFDSAL